MQSNSAQKSRRDSIRDLAENALKHGAGSLHNTEPTRRTLPPLHLKTTITPKPISTCHHGDIKFRFERVAKGTWQLRDSPR